MNDLLCGFRKLHSTQRALFRLIQSYKKELGNSYLVGKINIDFSKVYDCLPHDILTVILEVHRLDKLSLNLVNDYLTTWKQRTKTGASYKGV